MPKNKKTDSYDTKTLEKALIEVQNGGGIREVARKYGIPKSTLHFKLKNPDHKTSFGPSPYLKNEEETCLQNWIIELSKKGFPLKKEDLQSSVQRFLTDHPRPNPFKDNFPGDGWVRGFLKRHPIIAKRTSEGVTFSSACVSETDIRKWFSEIHQYFIDNNLLEVLGDPRRVFNGDESGFQLCPKTGKVLAMKGAKDVYSVETSSSKESITVMFTFSAAGESCTPMVVFNYQRIPQKVIENVPSDWGVGRSENGWMTSQVFFEYIGNVFYPYLVKEKIPLPVIYFLDGHKTHLTYEVSKLCTELKIQLIALYPNATRILQPADVAVFRPVKAAWKEATRDWLRKNPGQVINKVNFAGVLKKALEKSIKASTLINGFKVCGLLPFDPNAVNYKKCIPSTNTAADALQVENNDNTITFSTFLRIIGPTKVAELQKIEDVEDIDENLRILKKIYQSFTTTTSMKNTLTLENTTAPPTDIRNDNILPFQLPDNDIFCPTSPILTPIPNKTHEDETKTPSPSILHITNFDDISFQSRKNDNVTELLSSPAIVKEPVITILQDILIPQQLDICSSFSLCSTKKMNSKIKSTKISTVNEDIILPPQTLTNDSRIELCPITGIISRTTDDQNITEFGAAFEKTPIKNSDTIYKQRTDILQPLKQNSLTSDVSPAFKVIYSDLGSYLTTPKTPERKGKRNVVRMPFAITSERYKSMYKEQIEKKESESLKKEERKRVREEMKIKKAICKKTKIKEEAKPKEDIFMQDKQKQNVNKFKTISTNACKICLQATKTTNRVICDLCSLIYHTKCIPAKHQQHVPEEIKIDSFVCHKCYQETNDDDNSEVSENNSEEINYLFELCKTSKL